MFEGDEYQAESLTDIVMKLSGDPGAFVFVCLDQFAADGRPRLFGEFAMAAPM